MSDDLAVVMMAVAATATVTETVAVSPSQKHKRPWHVVDGADATPPTPPGSRSSSPVAMSTPLSVKCVLRCPERPTRGQNQRGQNQCGQNQQQIAIALRRAIWRKRMHVQPLSSPSWDWAAVLDEGDIREEVAPFYSMPLARGASMHALVGEIGDVVTEAGNVVTSVIAEFVNEW